MGKQELAFNGYNNNNNNNNFFFLINKSNFIKNFTINNLQE